jgi:hypothetical protein
MGYLGDSYCWPLLFPHAHLVPSHLITHLRVQGQIALGYLPQHWPRHRRSVRQSPAVVVNIVHSLRARHHRTYRCHPLCARPPLSWGSSHVASAHLSLPLLALPPWGSTPATIVRGLGVHNRKGVDQEEREDGRSLRMHI